MTEAITLFIDAWRLMVGRMPQPIIREDHDIVSCFGNVPLLLLNISIVGRRAESRRELRAFLQTAAEHADACTYPSSVLLCEEWLPAGWENVVADVGLAPMIPLTTMETEALLPPVRALPHLDVRRVVDDGMARDLATLNALAYDMAHDAFGCIGDMRLWQADSQAYVGYVSGKPVACAAAFPVDGTVYIALVATLPGEQGKEYGEVVMREAVTRGQRAMGTLRSTLHASDMGRALYRRLGYQAGPRMVILQRAT